MECKMKRLNFLIFFFLKGGLKSPNGFPNEKCTFYLLFFISNRIVLLTWIAFDPIFREKKRGNVRAPPRGNFHSGFDASHVLQLPADQPIFRKSNYGLLSRRTGTLEAESSVNGKPYIDRNQQE